GAASRRGILPCETVPPLYASERNRSSDVEASSRSNIAPDGLADDPFKPAVSLYHFAVLTNQRAASFNGTSVDSEHERGTRTSLEAEDVKGVGHGGCPGPRRCECHVINGVPVRVNTQDVPSAFGRAVENPLSRAPPTTREPETHDAYDE